jgi:hypothetical protein
MHSSGASIKQSLIDNLLYQGRSLPQPISSPVHYLSILLRFRVQVEQFGGALFGFRTFMMQKAITIETNQSNQSNKIALVR